MTVYAGFDVLPVEPDSSEGRGTDRSERRSTLVVSPVGIAATGYSEPAPRVARRVRWVCQGFAAVKEARDFLDARKGRAVPFWIPSMESDLKIRLLVEGGQTFFTIETIGYSARMFPGSGARRHIRIYEGAQTEDWKIINAVDGGTGFETIYTDSIGGFSVGASPSAFVSFMRLCRLAEDRARIEWIARNYAIVEFDAVEVPNEAPT